MKKLFLLLTSVILLSGCATSYDVPPQAITPYEERPAIVETVNRGAAVMEVDPVMQRGDIEKTDEPQEDNNLSNNNYYTNVDGNEVHSPAYSDSIPSGASAVCRDGTYSFSQHRQGTCSGHGGVANWY